MEHENSERQSVRGRGRGDAKWYALVGHRFEMRNRRSWRVGDGYVGGGDVSKYGIVGQYSPRVRYHRVLWDNDDVEWRDLVKELGERAELCAWENGEDPAIQDEIDELFHENNRLQRIIDASAACSRAQAEVEAKIARFKAGGGWFGGMLEDAVFEEDVTLAAITVTGDGDGEHYEHA